MADEIQDMLLIRKWEVVSLLPDRANITINVREVSSALGLPDLMYEENLMWIADEVKKGDRSKKMLIYCTSKTNVSDIFHFLMVHTHSDSFQETSNQNRIGTYFSGMDEDMEKLMLESFCPAGSDMRVMICTSAFGMGVQIPDVDIVVHWGVSRTVLDFWQEIGRCARDGRQGETFLYFTPYCLHPQRVEATFLQMCKDLKKTIISRNASRDDQVVCIRKAVLEHFLLPGADPSFLKELVTRKDCHENCECCCCQSCLCCSLCRGRCPCSLWI